MTKGIIMTQASPISISVVAGQTFLLFNIDDIKYVRQLGIVGSLVGTLPAAPQQNLFLGVPLQLMAEEALWLVEHGYAKLMPDDRFIRDIYDHLSDSDIMLIEHELEQTRQKERSWKIQEHQAKLDRLGVTKRGGSNDKELIEQGLTVVVNNTPSRLPSYVFFKRLYEESDLLQKNLLSGLRKDTLSYRVFSYLKSTGYYMAPGLRFGGRYIAYPGDPLRFHAHLIVNCVGWNEDIGLVNMVGGGRLATGVKKLWVIGSQDPDKDQNVQCFSVEWAGFG